MSVSDIERHLTRGVWVRPGEYAATRGAADRRRAEAATGYVAGGISPLGQRKRLPLHLDASALEHETVFVSAGRRGLELELDPNDLAALTGARVRPIAG